MEVRFLGTAASEGIPNPFCDCEICSKARRDGGKDVRTRASVLIDERIQVDMSPEWTYQLTREKLTARTIEAVLFTHTHPDHFNVGELVSRCVNFAYNVDFPLHIFGNDCAIKGAFNALDGLAGDRVLLQLVRPYEAFEHNGYKITPILSNHAKMELCYNYIVEKDGRTFFYGLDSGYLSETAFKFLENYQIHAAVLECTYAKFRKGDETNNHLNFESLFKEVARLRAQGTFQDTRVYASHVSHSSKMTHDEIAELLAEHDIILAHDGLNITV